jgi:signal transduction histidine kinase
MASARAPDSSMVSRSSKRLIVLFLAALVLPSALLVLLTVRSMRQERELGEKRIADELGRSVVQVRGALTARLQAIESQALSVYARNRSDSRDPLYADSAVRLVAEVAGGRLVLPWERASHIQDDSFADRIRAAEYAEFRRGDHHAAASHFREAIDVTRDVGRQGYARLSLARVLAKLERRSESEAEFAKVFRLGLDVTDEHGIPLAFYAASQVAASDPVLVMRRLAEAGKAWCCLPPEALYMVRQLVDTLAPRVSGAMDRGSAEALRRALDHQILRAEQSVALQAELSELGLAARPRMAADGGGPRWTLYGREPWFVSATPAERGAGAVLVAIDAVHVLSAVQSALSGELGIDASIRIAASNDSGERRLAPDFPGLSVTFASAPGVLSREGGIARPFYVGSLIVVLGVTLFGAYLLWRDLQRELRLSELRSQFVASVSHELKTPLTSIRMFAESLSMNAEQDAATRRQYLDTIVSETERLTRLLNNVLDFSKIERGQKQYRLTRTPLAEVVERSVRTLEYPLAQSGFRLRLETVADIPPVAVDGDAIEQAVLNLLTNAMKYSGESREIDLRLCRRNGEAVIEVQDRGVGLLPAHRARVVEKFYRAPTTENAGIPGTGLGLTLVDYIARAHGGRLEIESEAGRGSTFSIHLPIALPS